MPDGVPAHVMLLSAGRRLTTNSVLSLLGFVVPTVLLVACTPALVHRMGPTAYGLWSVSLAAFGLMGALELGLGTALSKFVAEYRAAGNLTAISATVAIALVAYAALGGILTVILLAAAHPLSRLFHPTGVPHATVVHIIELVSLGLVPLLLLSGALAIAVGLDRFEVPMVAMSAQSGLTILVALVIVEAGGSVVDAVLSSLAVLSCIAVLAAGVALRLLVKTGVRVQFRRGYARPLLRYTVFTGATSAGSLLFGSADRIVVGAVLGLPAVAYYGVSIGVASKLLTLADVAARPLLPAASAWAARTQFDRLAASLRQSTFLTACFSILIMAVVLVFSGQLLRLWMGSSFAAQSLTPLRVLLVVYGLLAIAAPAYHVANGIGKAWLPAVTGTVGGGLTLGLIALLGRSRGLTGAALANGAYLLNLGIPVIVAVSLRRQVHGIVGAIAAAKDGQ